MTRKASDVMVLGGHDRPTTAPGHMPSALLRWLRLAGFVAGTTLPALLTACSTGVPASIREACIAESAAGVVKLVDGYPVSMLQAAFHGVSGHVSGGGGVLQILIHDRLTGKDLHVGMEYTEGTVPEHSDRCGPKSIIVQRISIDGDAESGMSMQDGLYIIVRKAAAMAGFAQPQIDDQPQPSYPGAPPIGTHPAASVAPATSFASTPTTGPGALEGMPPKTGYVDSPELGNCHMDSCSWSKTLSRTVQVSGDGTSHTLSILGGTTANGDEQPAHIQWEAQPHTLTILCSKTTPRVTMGDQVDDLPLNAQGSPVPGVLMSSYALYAAECHPEAKDLDPDAFAKRFGYQAAVDQ